MTTRCVIFGGAPVRPLPGLRSRVTAATLVIAADAGARIALACGRTPDLVIGDLDSIAPRILARLRRLEIPIEVHPVDKAATDSELALMRALALGAGDVLLIGGLGGPRLDHALANVWLLRHPQFAGMRIGLLDNTNEVRLLRGGEEWRWQSVAGEYVSLIPMDGPAEGVRTSGLRWALDGDVLVPGSTRGVSNEAVTTEAGVVLASGSLLVVRSLPPALRDWPIPLDG